MEQAQAELHQSISSPSGKVSIGFTQPICNILAVPLMTCLEKEFPNIELSIYTGYSSDLIKMMKCGDIDLAVSSYDESDCKNINYELFFREKIYLLIGKNRFFEFDDLFVRKGAIRFSDLRHYEVMVTNRTDSLGYLIGQYEKETGFYLKKRQPHGQLMTTLRHVTEGHGMLITPSSSFFHLEKNDEVNAIDIVEPRLYRDVFLVSCRDKPVTNAMSKVIEKIRTVTRQENENGHWRGCFV